MIDWNSVVTTVLASSSITAIILAVLGFITKSVYEQLLSRDIEKFKSDREMELERFKSDLQTSVVEHQIRYQRLHTVRAEIVAELYRLLVEAEADADSLFYPWQDGDTQNKVKRALKSSQTLRDYFERNRIFFKNESCKKISHFIQELIQLFIDSKGSEFATNMHRDSTEFKERMNIWLKLVTELGSIKSEIEEEFRDILGL